MLAGAVPAAAAEVRADLTPDLIHEHCLVAGVGSETEGTFMLPAGRRVTGTVLCTADDLVAAKANPRVVTTMKTTMMIATTMAVVTEARSSTRETPRHDPR